MSAGITKWFRDAAERAVRAFVASFTALTLGGALFSNSAESVSLLQRAAIAGLGSATSVVLSLAAKWANDPDTASLVGVASPTVPVVPTGPGGE